MAAIRSTGAAQWSTDQTGTRQPQGVNMCMGQKWRNY